jgi:hypothetical protein
MRVTVAVGLAMALACSAASGFEPEHEGLDEPTAERAIRWTGEFQLRGDRVTGLPGGRADLQRLRGRLDLGLVSTATEGLQFGLGARARGGSDANRDSLANLDNEKADALALMDIWVGWRGEHWRLAAGKTATPLELTPLVWDEDFRPQGVSLAWSREAGGFNRFSLAATYADPDHPLGPSARLGALQAGWHWREGAPLSASVRLGLLDFSRIDGLARSGLGRGNSLRPGAYLHDYRLLDLQGELRTRLGDRPLQLLLDLVRNMEADDRRDGARASIVWGSDREPHGWELGFSAQRFQRDAVLAAFTSDDWWFHTGARGVMPWIGYGFDGRFSLRLSAFRETRDGLGESTNRILLDLGARW